MSDIGRINRKMERLLGYNPANEVRPDTKGALSEEVRWSEERRKLYLPQKEFEGEEIGKSFYYEDGRPNKFFRYKSRGKAGPSPEILGTVQVDFDNDLIYDIPVPNKDSDLEKKT